MVFKKWSKYIDATDTQKNKRIKEIRVMIALMEMKYKSNYAKGAKTIVLQGSFLLAIKMVIKHLLGRL